MTHAGAFFMISSSLMKPRSAQAFGSVVAQGVAMPDTVVTSEDLLVTTVSIKVGTLVTWIVVPSITMSVGCIIDCDTTTGVSVIIRIGFTVMVAVPPGQSAERRGEPLARP